MAVIDAYLDSHLTYDPVPIEELISEIREEVDAVAQTNLEVRSILLAEGLLVYDASVRETYARVRIPVRERLYELAVKGVVKLTRTEVSLA